MKRYVSPLSLCLLLLTSCSDDPAPKPDPVQPPQPITQFAPSELVWLTGSHISNKELADALAKAPQVKRIGIQNTRVDGEGLAKLVDFPSIETLVLTLKPDSRITSEDFNRLSALPNLSGLFLWVKDTLTAEWTEKLHTFAKLQTFETRSDILDEKTVAQFAQIETLKKIMLSGDVAPPAMAQISKIKTIESLYLSTVKKLSQAHFESFGKLPNLKNLSFTTREDAPSFDGVEGFQNLEFLNVRSYGKFLSIKSFEALSLLPKLNSLDLHNHEITDAELKIVAKSKSLRRLNLEFCSEITDVGIEAISKMAQLEALDISSIKKMTDAGYEKIQNLTQLKVLRLQQLRKISKEAHLRTLPKLTQLTELDLSMINDPITPEVLKKIAMATPQMKRINLSGLRVSKEVVSKTLSQWKNLTHLNLANVRDPETSQSSIDDSVVQAILNQADLQYLNIESNVLTQGGFEFLSHHQNIRRLIFGGGFVSRSLAPGVSPYSVFKTLFNFKNLQAIILPINWRVLSPTEMLEIAQLHAKRPNLEIFAGSDESRGSPGYLWDGEAFGERVTPLP